MQRLSDLFIDLSNEKQVKWWNGVGNRLVKAEYHRDLLNEVNQPIGHFVWLKEGLFNKYVIRKMKKLNT